MKKLILLSISLQTVLISSADSWIQKNDFGGGDKTAAVAFVINGKGYVGTGDGNANNDLWEYDPAIDAWTQKANIPAARSYAAAFAINGKGYVGTGLGSTYLKDFWEYDPSANAWAQKANFSGAPRLGAVGFSIGDKGYLGTGGAGSGPKQDFYQYDPASDTWTKKANLPGATREFAVGLVIGDKGYLGMGGGLSMPLNDFWQYDPSSDSWSQKANFGGAAREQAVAFVIGTKGYVGIGDNFYKPPFQDFWEYNPSTDAWLQKTNYGGGKTTGAIAFVIGNIGYVGTGVDSTSAALKSDIWQYTPDCNSLNVYADADADGYGDASNSTIICDSILPGGYVYSNTDCNDANASIHPGAAEACSNGIDDNCNGQVDEGCCSVPTGLAATPVSGSKEILQWNAAAGAVRYNVRYKVAGNNPWTTVSTMSPSKTISGLSANTTYSWQVKSVCSIAPLITSAWSAKQTFTTGLRLQEAAAAAGITVYPNPFTSSAAISFSLQQSSKVTINLFDLSGEKVATVIEENFEQGDHSVPLDRRRLAAGIYLLKIKMNQQTELLKIAIQ